MKPEKITKITPEESIWWSNAFHTVNAQYVRGLQGVKDCIIIGLVKLEKIRIYGF